MFLASPAIVFASVANVVLVPIFTANLLMVSVVASDSTSKVSIMPSNSTTFKAECSADAFAVLAIVLALLAVSLAVLEVLLALSAVVLATLAMVFVSSANVSTALTLVVNSTTLLAESVADVLAAFDIS